MGDDPRARSVGGAHHRGVVPGLPMIVGLTAVVSSAVYFLSDVIELAQGGFSTSQLVLTYAAEATLPLFVLGIYAVQRPQIGRLGFVGAVLYAYTYIYFTGTVTYCLVERTPDWDALSARMGPWLTVHGALMVVAGTCLGLAVARAGVLPRWTGYALVAGVILVAVANDMPDVVRTVAAGVRATAFVAMGVAILRMRAQRRPARSAPGRSAIRRSTR